MRGCGLKVATLAKNFFARVESSGYAPRTMSTDDPNEPPAQDLTGLLQAWGNGDRSALDQLTPLIYSELHRLAKRYMAREQAANTLETGALLNEAFLRLVHWKTARWEKWRREKLVST